MWDEKHRRPVFEEPEGILGFFNIWKPFHEPRTRASGIYSINHSDRSLCCTEEHNTAQHLLSVQAYILPNWTPATVQQVKSMSGNLSSNFYVWTFKFSIALHSKCQTKLHQYSKDSRAFFRTIFTFLRHILIQLVSGCVKSVLLITWTTSAKVDNQKGYFSKTFNQNLYPNTSHFQPQ